MTTFTGFDANQAIVDFYGSHSADLPEHQKDFLRDTIAGRDSLRTVIVAMETLYASRAHAAFPAAGLTLLKGLATFIEGHNFYGLAERARDIITTVERIEAGGAAEDAADVAASMEYAAQEPQATGPLTT